MSDDQSTCSLCSRPVRCRGYCGPHYCRLLKYGDPLAGGNYLGEPRTFVERLEQLKRTSVTFSRDDLVDMRISFSARLKAAELKMKGTP